MTQTDFRGDLSSIDQEWLVSILKPFANAYDRVEYYAKDMPATMPAKTDSVVVNIDHHFSELELFADEGEDKGKDPCVLLSWGDIARLAALYHFLNKPEQTWDQVWEKFDKSKEGNDD